METIGERDPVERPMDLEQSSAVEVNLEGLHLYTNIVSDEQHVLTKCCKKRKPEESLDEQDPNSSNESNECQEILKKRKREESKSMQESMILKQATDELDLMCKIWVMELRRLPLDQQLFARKAVCDVLFEARLGQLNKDSVRINCTDVVQNYLTSVHEEHGKICACPIAWQHSQRRCPTSSLQLYPGHSNCYSKGIWKGNISSPHRPPFFTSYSNNRFAAPNTILFPTGPRIGRPTVITTALNITTAAVVAMTPRLLISTAPSASSINNQAATTSIQGPSGIISVNIPPYKNSTCTCTTATNSPADPLSASNANNPPIPGEEPVVRNHLTTIPAVNTSTTPTINTLCDVRMDTLATDN